MLSYERVVPKSTNLVESIQSSTVSADENNLTDSNNAIIQIYW